MEVMLLCYEVTHVREHVHYMNVCTDQFTILNQMFLDLFSFYKHLFVFCPLILNIQNMSCIILVEPNA